MLYKVSEMSGLCGKDQRGTVSSGGFYKGHSPVQVLLISTEMPIHVHGYMARSARKLYLLVCTFGRGSTFTGACPFVVYVGIIIMPML